ncbi:MAG: SAM-dependent methyltransferase [Candidimonas sp.]|nr:MAG: SAM-dependent methyltransferase [Candidimonas sp.]
MNTVGTLHLIPVGLGEAPPSLWLPTDAQALVSRLTVFIAENAKTARSFLKRIGTAVPVSEITIHTLNATTRAAQIEDWLAPLRRGGEIGLVSEAGCPAVADPGARVAAAAHRMGLRVVPWVGPSSILLALMASGLEGQRFAFHGYAPVAPGARAATIKTWETASRCHDQTQLFIETPYRNTAVFHTLLQTLAATTRLCVARSLTTQEEWIRTAGVAEWKTRPPPELHKRPTIFLFQARP